MPRESRNRIAANGLCHPRCRYRAARWNRVSMTAAILVSLSAPAFTQ
jgi:hypothetical protein